MSERRSSSVPFNINEIRLPDHICHLKNGQTLATNGRIILVQDGPTTLEFCTAPKFDMKRIPWTFGLLRDMDWCEDSSMFILLTKNGLYGLHVNGASRTNADLQIVSFCFSKVVPFDREKSFWRFCCAGSSVYIVYSGFGSIIDEYVLSSRSCEFVRRWTPPTVCSVYDGIWSLRFHPRLNQIGWSVMDSQADQWRFETRQPKTLQPLIRVSLPLTHGDCEVSMLPNNDWLMINSFGILLLQLTNGAVKHVVQYERELKNAIQFDDDYFVIRTKNTVDFHKIKKKKN